MTLTKADMGQKIAENCDFMKGEAIEVPEKLLEIIKGRLIAGPRLDDLGFWKMVCEQQTSPPGKESSDR